jgi:hypothetical protein
MMAAARMTLDRLRQVLDAYGASQERWPADERATVARLLSDSPEARTLRDDAARLDALLDLVPARQPSAALVARALAGAPHDARQSRWRRTTMIAVPLAAAAAALLVWLLPRGGSTGAPDAPQYAIEDLGVYTTPTDVLLDLPGFDLSGSAPVVGCGADGLGCPLDDDRQSSLSSSGRHSA